MRCRGCAELGTDAWSCVFPVCICVFCVHLHLRVRAVQYKAKLPEYAQEYWTANLETLRHGMIHTGRLDKFFALFAREHMSKHVSEEVGDGIAKEILA